VRRRIKKSEIRRDKKKDEQDKISEKEY